MDEIDEDLRAIQHLDGDLDPKCGFVRSSMNRATGERSAPVKCERTADYLAVCIRCGMAYWCCSSCHDFAEKATRMRCSHCARRMPAVDLFRFHKIGGAA